MNKVFAIAGAIALSIIPTPTFSGEVEQKEIMSVTEQLLPQIGEKYKNLDIKEKKRDKLVIPPDQSKFKVISNLRHGVRHLRFVVLPKPCYINRSQKKMPFMPCRCSTS